MLHCGVPVLENGVWVPNLAPKQFEILNCYKRFTLVSGPRKSSKTRGVQHRVMRHAWEAAPRTRIGVFTKTIKNAKIGTWDTLFEVVAREWAENLEDFKIVRPLSIDGATKMLYFRVSNRYGGESEFQLHSLDNDNEIAAKLKNTEFSCIWVTELTNFRDRKVFDLSKEQLRMPGCPYENHLWIADTNPDEEEGDLHWAHKVWYEERIQEKHPFPGFQSQLHLIEVMLDDNPFLDPREKDDLKASYSHDPDLFKVYVEGKWIQTSKDSIFSGVFSRARHVPPDEDELVPEDSTTKLYVGWDPGDSNAACMFLEKIEQPGGAIWKVLDELVETDSQLILADYSQAVCDAMDEWEERIGKKFEWIHLSDEQATTHYRSNTGTYDSMEIFNATGGRVRLQGVPKFSGSVRLRVKLMRDLLSQGKIFISPRCERLIASLNGGLKKDKSRTKFLTHNRHIHPFDACTYPIQAESVFDLMSWDSPRDTVGFSSRL